MKEFLGERVYIHTDIDIIRCAWAYGMVSVDRVPIYIRLGIETQGQEGGDCGCRWADPEIDIDEEIVSSLPSLVDVDDGNLSTAKLLLLTDGQKT